MGLQRVSFDWVTPTPPFVTFWAACFSCHWWSLCLKCWVRLFKTRHSFTVQTCPDVQQRPPAHQRRGPGAWVALGRSVPLWQGMSCLSVPEAWLCPPNFQSCMWVCVWVSLGDGTQFCVYRCYGYVWGSALGGPLGLVCSLISHPPTLFLEGEL